MKYLVDTNKIIDFLRNKEKTVAELSSLFPKGISISIITVAEYLHGAHKSFDSQRNTKVFEKFLEDNQIQILEVDYEVAQLYGEIQGKLEKEGKRGNGFDMLIAATCLKHNLALVTDDPAFKRVSGLKLGTT